MDLRALEMIELRHPVRGKELRLLGLNLGLTVFFPIPFREAAPALSELFERFLSMVPPETFAWQNLGGTSQGYRPITRTALTTVRAWLGLERKYGSMCAVWLKDGADVVDVGDHLFQLVGRDQPYGEGDSNYLQILFPATQLAQGGAEPFLAGIHGLLQHLPFHSGYLGYTLGPSTLFNVLGYAAPIAARSYAAARRFRGLETFMPFAECQQMARRLRPPSWVTFVSSKLLDELGGLDVVRAVPGDLQITPLDHGVSIRAGAAPLLADSNRAEDVAPEQKALARVLEPLYPDAPAVLFLERPQEDTRAWLRRYL